MKHPRLISLSHGLRRAFATAMLMPFLALCLISPAAMLERGASGKMVLVLCTGDGAVEMTVDLGTGAPQTKQRCDWAAAHTASVYTAPFTLPLWANPPGRATAATTTVLWHPAFDPRNLWARGPPSLV